eukprot:CAMPEP_0198361694 /NCGR_PEP_ID=MMETSP1450-20131203/143271_1 /TAXON_ID=753684 ORGANISM="Madagascaria erythrocladiodes, Strain CCMP3234" /NCGR_SAMPLE_ID=MMETSP1450 /ASSEMBLY_ACC=CAM_ASM_001115 /LENGTH=54 /DNA_ID=CAMNT_0044068821 /DNA_START=36 /DNA_END=196 /DNA_ORIENTATION=-
MSDLQDFFAKKDRKKKKGGKVKVTSEDVEAIGKTVSAVTIKPTKPGDKDDPPTA